MGETLEQSSVRMSSLLLLLEGKEREIRVGFPLNTLMMISNANWPVTIETQK